MTTSLDKPKLHWTPTPSQRTPDWDGTLQAHTQGMTYRVYPDGQGTFTAALLCDHCGRASFVAARLASSTVGYKKSVAHYKAH